MKQLLTLGLLLPSFAFAQSLVSTLPQQRTVLLEDFTGINCQYCPDGHTIMESIETAAPSRVALLGIHAGGYAVPGAGQPDLRTPWGDAMNTFFTVMAYPSGVLDRHTFPAGLALGRGAWQSAAQELLAMPSPVNLGLASSFDALTREATIQVEYRYTADSPGPSDRLNVIIKENHITGPQVSAGIGTIPAYDHKHVVRVAVTPTWGDEVTTTTAGSTEVRTYTFTIPEGWNADNCMVVAFIGEHQSDVYQAQEVPLNGGTTLVVGSLGAPSTPYASGEQATAETFTSGFTSFFEGTTDFLVTLETLEAPGDWSGAFNVNGTSHQSSATVTMNEQDVEDIVVAITPGATAGIGRYRLTVASQSAAAAPTLSYDVAVIAGVTDLVVSNPATEALAAEARYLNGLTQAGNTHFAKMDRDAFIGFHGAGALSGVLNIYRNVSWTFPSLLDAEVAALAAMMDQGVNLMIAGQDIGWDQSGADGSYGTAATQAFFTSHMLATFVNDGSTANTPVNFVDADPIFGGLANSAVANVFAGNTYPEEITPIAPATAIINYGTTAKIGGLRALTDHYKLVYLGVGPEQFADAQVGTDVVRLSHDWFYGLVSVEEFEAQVGGLGQPFPVPADGQLQVPVDLKTAAVLTLHDATGRLVLEQKVAAQTTLVDISTANLGNGLYSLRLQTANGHGLARSITIAH